MRIGVPREIKEGESRVGLIPEAVRDLVECGHQVLVGEGAGAHSGFPDAEYRAAGATAGALPRRVYGCDLIVKVKELQSEELGLLSPGSLLFGFAHLADRPAVLSAVIASGVSVLAFECVEDSSRGRPILAPMSQIAGCLAPQIAAQGLCSVPGLSAPTDRAGVLLSPVAGLKGAKVVVVGAGNVGREAARIASGIGCEVIVLARSRHRFAAVQSSCPYPVDCQLATDATLTGALCDAQVLIGAVLDRTQRAPRLVTRSMLRSMAQGAVYIDVGIDQGGIGVTCRPTTLSDPWYVEEGVLHYGVPNIPALVPKTASRALSKAVLPYARLLASLGFDAALRSDPGLARALQVHAYTVSDPGLLQPPAAGIA